MPDFDQTPAVTLLITPRLPPLSLPPGAPASPDSGLYATLVTTGTPAQSPYLRADRFEMRRVSDGARFAWRPFATPREVVGFFPLPGAFGNYFLPRSSNTAGLGSDSIVPGAVYELIVESGPHRIVGRTVVPGPVEFVREPADGDSIVRWRRTPGAAAYAIGGEFFAESLLMEDTVLFIRRRGHSTFAGAQPRREFVRVFALDSNYAGLRGDFRVSQAGVSGGWGVFGSFNWADMDLPPTAETSAAPR